MPEISLNIKRRIHVIGVAGPGMSALATVLAEMGHDVSGSDLRDLPVLDRVRASGVRVSIGHIESAVDGCDFVVASSIIPETNIEWVAAQSKGIACVRRAEMLAAVCGTTNAVAVAGTHGKTTSSAMLTLALIDAGMNPSYLIGGDVPGLAPDKNSDALSSAHWSGSGHMIVEADESDGTHSVLPIDACLVTNIDTDHLDHFGNFASIVASFTDFIGRSRLRVLNSEDPNLARIASVTDAVTFGFSGTAKYRGSNLVTGNGHVQFTVANDAVGVHQVDLAMFGVHNAANALGVFAMACELGADPTAVVRALARYKGTVRRCELRETVNGARMYDDYAHLPAEIGAVLAGVRADGSCRGRLIAVFQPNRFNRMAVLSPAYADAFVDADLVYINNVYSSGTAFIEGVTGQLVVDAVLAAHPDAKIHYIEDREALVSEVLEQLGDGDVCVSMGCGDIEHFPSQVAQLWQAG